MRKWLLSGLLVGSALACWPSAALAAPANDAFSAAAPLTVGADVSSSNVDATVEAGEPDPTGFAASESCPNIAAGPSCGTSVWYTFQAPSTGQYTISTCDGGTDVYSIVGVYTGTTIGTAVQVAAWARASSATASATSAAPRSPSAPPWGPSTTSTSPGTGEGRVRST